MSLIFAELNLAELIFAIFGLFREIKFRETFNKSVIRENKFREISQIWKPRNFVLCPCFFYYYCLLE